jgi:DNA-binding NarL/FixJ family response regulator
MGMGRAANASNSGLMTTSALASPLFDSPAAPPRRLPARTDQQASGTIRVAIAHGRQLARARLRALLERQPGIAIVGEAANGDDAVALTARVQPDVVVIGVDLPGLDCVEATRRILAGQSVAVMVLTASETDARLIATLRAGATGHLPEHWDPAALVRAIRLLGNGGHVSSRRSHRTHPITEAQMLTPKVIEITRGRAHGAPARPLRLTPEHSPRRTPPARLRLA